MILTQSSSARIRNSIVSAIISTSATFRQFMCYSAITISQAISGTIGIVKNGSGTLTLSGACNYTGPTQINAGSLAISTPISTTVSTLNGVISGAGSFIKSGPASLTIGGNNTYTGGTSSSLGFITFSSGNAFGTGLFTAAGNSQIVTGNSVTMPNNFQINSGVAMQFRVNTQTTILTVTGNLAGSGSVNKTSTGRLYLTGNLTYTGSTSITAGFLRTFKTVGASLATATFYNATGATSLSVSFDVSPPSGTTNFRFFQGTTVQSFTSITLSGVPAGTTATYNSANSTLSVTVP